MTLPSMDDILAQGRKRERKTAVVLGAIIVAGGLACKLGGAELFGDESTLATFGAIGCGMALIGYGLAKR